MNQPIQPQMLAEDKLLTGEFTGSFVHVFQMHQFGTNDPSYSVEMLFEPNDPTIQMMVQLINKAAQEKWGANIPQNFKSPIRDGNTKAQQYPEMANKYFVRASSKTRKPLVIDRDKSEILEQGKVYSGAKYRAIINPFAYSTQGNNGVSFGFTVLQKLQDGNPLSGGVPDPSAIPDLPPIAGQQQMGMPQQQQAMPQQQMGMPQQQQMGMPQQQQMGMPQQQQQAMPQQQQQAMPQQQQQAMPQQQPGGGQNFVPTPGGNVDLNNY